MSCHSCGQLKLNYSEFSLRNCVECAKESPSKNREAEIIYPCPLLAGVAPGSPVNADHWASAAEKL